MTDEQLDAAIALMERRLTGWNRPETKRRGEIELLEAEEPASDLQRPLSDPPTGLQLVCHGSGSVTDETCYEQRLVTSSPRLELPQQTNSWLRARALLAHSVVLKSNQHWGLSRPSPSRMTVAANPQDRV
jgi:hypothetical protein